MNLVDWARCKLGKPRCHRELRNGIDYAMCNWCKRQSEVHEFGGPRPRQVLMAWNYCIVDGCDKPSVPYVEAPPGAPFCAEHDWDDVRERKGS